MEPMLSVPSTDYLCYVDLANLISASLLVVHAIFHVLATAIPSYGMMKCCIFSNLLINLNFRTTA